MEKLKYDGNEIVSWDKCDWRPKTTEAPAKVMKLSEAIRIGCAMAPEVKNKGSYYGECGGTCALGAAHEALIGRAKKDFGICGTVTEFLKIPSTVVSEAIGYFYVHTREETADWLESRGY